LTTEPSNTMKIRPKETWQYAKTSTKNFLNNLEINRSYLSHALSLGHYTTIVDSDTSMSSR